MALRNIDGLIDERESPDNLRKGAFKTGWGFGVASRRDNSAPEGCSPETLVKKLTWWNLGYRLGNLLGDTSVELVEEIYDLLARQFVESAAKRQK
jgi:hypothetical protein